METRVPVKKYQILVKRDHVGVVVDDWLYNGMGDLRLRPAKTDGCRVIETTDALYASRIVKWLHAAEKVNIVNQ